MFKTIEIGEQPIMMNVNAQAIWNSDKGCWEVSIVSTESNTCHYAGNEKYTTCQNTYQAEVEICDEFVLACALLDMNGVNVKEALNMEYDPISNDR